VNLQNKGGWTPLYLATDNRNIEGGDYPVPQPDMNHLEFIKVLLDHGADPQFATDFGNTALSAAAGIGWVEGVTYEHSAAQNVEAVKMLLNLGLDANSVNRDGRTPLMGAALKGRSDVVQLLVDHGAKLDTRDHGSRDTDTSVSKIAGHTWQALDYADGLVRVGVQSAVTHPETAALLRKLMMEKSLPVPPANRIVDSICIVEICKERQSAP
jgi:ankyrin repeat protein